MEHQLTKSIIQNLARVAFNHTSTYAKHIATSARSRLLSSSSTQGQNEKQLTVEEESRVLQVLNTATVDEIMKYRITKDVAENIITYRTGKSRFEKVQDMKNVSGINSGAVDSLIRSFLKTKQAAKYKINKLDVCVPLLPNEAAKNLNEIVSIHIWPSLVSTAKLSRDNQLLDWKLFSVEQMKGLNYSEIWKIVSRLCATLPQADAYFLDTTFRSQSLRTQLDVETQCYMCFEAMLIACINSNLGRHSVTNCTQPLGNLVYIVKTQVVARMFDLLIGHEITACQGTAEGILVPLAASEVQTPQDPRSALVRAPPKFVELFKSLHGTKREALARALLLGVVSNRLFVHKIEEKLDLATFGSKQVKQR